MSDENYYDETIIGTGEAGETWDEQYVYQDQDGLLYTERDAHALVNSGEYEFADEEQMTADTPMEEWGGATMRQIWNTLPDNERRSAREAYATERYRQLKEGS
jgi:hypothetical protein